MATSSSALELVSVLDLREGMIAKWQLQSVASMLFRGKNSMVYKSHGDSTCAL